MIDEILVGMHVDTKSEYIQNMPRRGSVDVTKSHSYDYFLCYNVCSTTCRRQAVIILCYQFAAVNFERRALAHLCVVTPAPEHYVAHVVRSVPDRFLHAKQQYTLERTNQLNKLNLLRSISFCCSIPIQG